MSPREVFTVCWMLSLAVPHAVVMAPNTPGVFSFTITSRVELRLHTLRYRSSEHDQRKLATAVVVNEGAGAP